MCRVCHIKRLDNAPLPASAMGYSAKYWKTGSTLTWSVLGGSIAHRAFIKRGFDEWAKWANLRFVYVDDWQSADCRIQLDPSGGSWSYVGTDNLAVSRGAPTMNLGWIDDDMKFNDLSTVLHEIGHFLGLGHEHQNPTEPFDWDRQTVIRELSGAPNHWTIQQIEHNVLNQVPIDEVDATTLDRLSIMMYFFPDHWVRSGKGTKQNKVLSALDKAFIGTIYPFAKRIDEEVDDYIRAMYGTWGAVRRMSKKQLKRTLDELHVAYSYSSNRFELRRVLFNHLKTSA